MGTYMRFCTGLMLAALLIGQEANAAALSLNPAAGSYNVGSTFTVEISADSTGESLVAADAQVQYNPALLALEAIDTAGSSFQYPFGVDPASFPIKRVNTGTGLAQVVVALPTPGVNGSALRVASLRFRVLAPATSSVVKLVYTAPGAPGDSNLIRNDRTGTDVLRYAYSAEYTLIGTNAAPVATNAQVTTLEDYPISGSLHATDPENNPLTYSLVGAPSLGSVAITNSSTGTYNYTPRTNVNGSESFSFRAYDGTNYSNTATVAITITPENDAPVARDDSAATTAGIAVNVAVLANDSDADGDVLSVTSYTQATQGVVGTATGGLRYAPNAGFSGTDSFTYTIADSRGASATATVRLTVNPTNRAPVAQNGSLTTSANTAAGGTLSASDPDGSPITFSLVSAPTLGTVAITNAATGAYVYTPNTGAIGTDSFAFRASDGALTSNSATVSITINPINHAPVAQNGAVATMQNTAVSAVLSASDTDGDPLSYSVVTAPALGTVTITNASTGAYTYTPRLNASGTDSFGFRASDGRLSSNTATVTVNISVPNGAPTARDDSATTEHAISVVIDVLANDNDPEGEALQLRSFTQGVRGMVDPFSGGLRYTPNLGFTGTDSFTYVISDSSGHTAGATVYVTVTPVNGYPIVGQNAWSTPYNTALQANLIASDPEGDALTFAITSLPKLGSVTLGNAATGAFSYQPRSAVTGEDYFEFSVKDARGATSGGTARITIQPYPCGACSGDVTRLTIRYNGTRTIDLIAEQRDGDEDDSQRIYRGFVGPGQTVELYGGDRDGTMDNYLRLRDAYGKISSVTIRTDCRSAVGPGLVAGPYEVISGFSRYGGPLCPVK